MRKAPHKILIVQPWGLGDALMTVPLLSLARASFPDAHLGIMVGTDQAAILFRSSSLADSVFVMNVKAPIWQWVLGFAALRGKSFDACIVATRLSWRYAFLARWIGGIGIVVSDNANAFTRWWTTVVNAADARHRIQANARLLTALVPSLDPQALEAASSVLPVSLPSAKVRCFLNDLRAHENAPVYGVHLGSGSQPVKRVPTELASAVVEELVRRNRRTKFLYIEGPEDPAFSTLPQGLRDRLVHIADWSLLDMFALLGQLDAVLTGDTGISHLAAAAGGRAIVVAGPTNVAMTGPWGPSHAVITTAAPPPCMPCYGTPNFRSCPFAVKCLTSIPARDVVAAIEGTKADSL